MGDNSRKSGLSLRISGVFSFVFILLAGGCGDFFEQKPTELQSKAVLSELKEVRTVPDPDIPVPYIYKQPPAILETKDGVKLFYFTQYHTVGKFAGTNSENPGLIQQQFNYKVSQNPATNQLIIECPTREEAETVLQFLEQVDVPPVQVRIDCLISELYADLTMDRETTLEIENLFGEKIFLGGKRISELVGEEVVSVLKPAFPGASLRDEARELIGLKVGISRGAEGHRFTALIDLLISRGYLKILMNPSLEVVNGQTAKIEARDFVPIPKEVEAKGANVLPYMTTEYQWVIDSLEITPHVFADGYIGLETAAQIGSKSTPEGVKQIPIITERKIQNKENRIRQGESLIIGGIRKSEERDVVRGVPFLKDIPLIGLLFSSRDFEERAKEVIFIITPTISTGGIPNEEIVEMLRKKHEPPVTYDIFDFDAGEKELQRKTLEAEEARLEAEAEKAKAQRTVREAKEQLKKARADAEKVKLMLKELNKNLKSSNP
ncbi:MAG: type II secretion system protein GspD [Planctomycetota bacterium]|jgi:type II secretory pathway component GspD/PulD (secretin)